MLILFFVSCSAGYEDNYESDLKEVRQYGLLGGVFMGLFLVDSLKEAVYLQAGTYGVARFEASRIEASESLAVYSRVLPVARFNQNIQNRYIKECMASVGVGIVAGYGLKFMALHLYRKLRPKKVCPACCR